MVEGKGLGGGIKHLEMPWAALCVKELEDQAGFPALVARMWTRAAGKR